MNVFDIIGPVMVGPSSSHTAGAVRIGNIAAALLGERTVKARIKFHGSFAKTYRGHGTDRAIIGGIMGMKPDDERIRQSLELAGEMGLEYSFEATELKDAHPNTAVIELTGAKGKKIVVTGASVGGGNIVIKKINGIDVDFTGQFYTLVVTHVDSPGAVAAVTNKLAEAGINIAQMKVYRSQKYGSAVMVIETDQQITESLEPELAKLSRITGITVIRPVQ